MSQRSNIEWTDGTWNPVRGCTKVSPGCAHCYAETFAERFRGVKGHPYEQGFDLRLVPEKLTEPLTWKKPKRVFVNSMSDLFQDGVPVEFIDRVFAVMALAPQHTFQVLTKRAERMWAYVESRQRPHVAVHIQAMLANADTPTLTPETPWPLPNVWLGVSVENQHVADERIPLLLQTPAAVRFISAEPLLDALALSPFLGSGWRCACGWHDAHETGPAFTMTTDDRAFCPDCMEPDRWLPSLDWVIVGGESGPGARPLNVAWVRSIVQQCQGAGVPVFVKQLGAVPFDAHERLDHARQVVTNRLLLASRKGGDPDEWPRDLRVREFPAAP